MNHCPRCRTRYPEGRLSACPRCLLEEPLPALKLGERLEIGEQLGRGGMGAVFRATDLRLGRTVAVKLLADDLAGAAREEFLQRFEREARSLALLNHPNIVSVFDYGTEAGQTYLVMELVGSGTLAERMPMPVMQALALTSQICEALDYAHQQGVIHRDIKPANILLDGKGQVKVADFGIARIVRSDVTQQQVTATELVAGTPHYMAPEALRGAPPDPRMDIYALGVVLYQMLTGELPRGRFSPPPGPLVPVLERALAPDPEARYQTAGELCAALEQARIRLWESGEPTALHTPPATEAATALPPDEWIWLYAVSTLLTAVSALGILAIYLSLIPKKITRADVHPLYMVWTEPHPDRTHVISYMRFEVWPMLATLAALPLALLGYGALRRHWRRSGLDRPVPDAPISTSRWVLAGGLTSILIWLSHHLLLSWGYTRLVAPVPIFGGILLTGVLYLVWLAILQAWRIQRPLHHEPVLWIGFALALIPPMTKMLSLLGTVPD